MLFGGIIAVYCENHTEHTNALCGQNAVYINSVRTSQETYSVSITTTNRLMLFREIIAVYCENHTEHINTLCGQNAVYINSVRT
jgi:translation initiation factor IF-1